jgi:hypothetical protein
MNNSLKRLSLILITTLLLSSCAEGAPPPAPTVEAMSFKFFQDGYYKVIVPEWEESLALDEDSIFTVQKDGQFIAVNRYQNLPEIFADQFLAYIEEDPNAYLVQHKELEGRPFFEFTNRENNQTIRLYAVLDYCQGQTYTLVAGGRDTVENAELFNQVLSSSQCDDPYQIPELETGKIGMMINPAQDDFWEGYYPALRLAKTNGVQVAHSYLQWGQVESSPGEYNWDWQDALMGYRFHEGFEVSLVINLIHTAVRGPMPEDLRDRAFDDPEFIERFTAFILEVLDRYPVQYLSIGNEVNDYFINHRDEIPAYQTFFLEVNSAIKEQYPDVMVGMTFAYHDAEYSDSLDIIQQLNLGDFLPLTLYIYSRPGFLFNQEPSELEGYLNRILELADDTPVALAEIGWNTAENLEGSQEDQAEFVREAFRLLDQHKEQILFLSWFSLHDTLPENSYQAALTFIPEGSHLRGDEAFMAVFVDFINYLGLFENDGTPKQAWLVFQEEASNYLLNQP